MKYLTNLNDEELLLAARLGDHKAEARLAENYFSDRRTHALFVAESATLMLDEWDLEEAFFRSFTSSTAGFRFGSSKFLSYFLTILKNEIIHLVSKKARRKAMKGNRYSLDTLLNDGQSDSCCLSDFIASTDFMDDPRAFLIYAEQLEELHRLPKKEDPMMLDAVRLLASNYTLAETARICGITTNRVKYLINRYRRWTARSHRLIANFGKKK